MYSIERRPTWTNKALAAATGKSLRDRKEMTRPDIRMEMDCIVKATAATVRPYDKMPMYV